MTTDLNNGFKWMVDKEAAEKLLPTKEDELQALKKSFFEKAKKNLIEGLSVSTGEIEQGGEKRMLETRELAQEQIASHSDLKKMKKIFRNAHVKDPDKLIGDQEKILLFLNHPGALERLQEIRRAINTVIEERNTVLKKHEPLHATKEADIEEINKQLSTPLSRGERALIMQTSTKGSPYIHPEEKRKRSPRIPYEFIGKPFYREAGVFLGKSEKRWINRSNKTRS